MAEHSPKILASRKKATATTTTITTIIYNFRIDVFGHRSIAPDVTSDFGSLFDCSLRQLPEYSRHWPYAIRQTLSIIVPWDERS